MVFYITNIGFYSTTKKLDYTNKTTKNVKGTNIKNINKYCSTIKLWRYEVNSSHGVEGSDVW
jgi:hypothetical protein